MTCFYFTTSLNIASFVNSFFYNNYKYTNKLVNMTFPTLELFNRANALSYKYAIKTRIITSEEFASYSIQNHDLVIDRTNHVISIYPSNNINFTFYGSYLEYKVTCAGCDNCINCVNCNRCNFCNDCINCDECMCCDNCRHCYQCKCCDICEHVERSKYCDKCRYCTCINYSNELEECRHCHYSEDCTKNKNCKFAMHSNNNENCIFIEISSLNSNCGLISTSSGNDNCYFMKQSDDNKSCNFVKNATTCTSCLFGNDLTNSSNCSYSNNIQNCDITTYTYNCNDCKNILHTTNCKNCKEMQFTLNSKYCENCKFIDNCNSCFESQFIAYSNNSKHCLYSTALDSCNDIEYKYSMVSEFDLCDPELLNISVCYEKYFKVKNKCIVDCKCGCGRRVEILTPIQGSQIYICCNKDNEVVYIGSNHIGIILHDNCIVNNKNVVSEICYFDKLSIAEFLNHKNIWNNDDCHVIKKFDRTGTEIVYRRYTGLV